MRADQLLVAHGLAPSRSAAQRLIERGAVRWRAGGAGWSVPRKAGDDLPEGCTVEVVDDAETRWVSRGGLKLEAVDTAQAFGSSHQVDVTAGVEVGFLTDRNRILRIQECR